MSSFIDVRDLAEWTVRMIEGKETGVYNANGLPNNLTMERVLEECKRVSASNASFTWVSEEFLMQEKVAPWSEIAALDAGRRCTAFERLYVYQF